MSADGVTVRGEGRVAVEISLTGLTPGRHSLVTWHNWLSDKSAPGPCDVAVDGAVIARGVKPAAGATNDFDAASAFVEFTAKAGQSVVVRVEAEGAVVLNGFELDTTNPALRANRHIGALDLRNNVVFNWKSRAMDGGAARVQFVNNYYKPGPATAHFYELVPQFENLAFGPQIYFVAGNVMEGRHGPEGPLGPFVGTRAKPETAWEKFTVATPWFESFVTTHSAAESYTNVLSDVGCNRPALDEHDARVIAEVRAGTAQFKGSTTGLPGLPDTQEDVGGWENYPVERRAANWDSDHDGMPDEWEQQHGLNPKDASDGAKDADADGYTNLEEFLNGTNPRQFVDYGQP